MKTITKGLSVVLFMTTLGAGAVATSGSSGVVTTQGSPLQIRAGKGVDTAIITGVANGETLTVLETSGDWYKVKLSDGQTGYAHRKYIKMASAEVKKEVATSAEVSEGVVATQKDALLIRAGTSKSNDKIIAKVPKGANVQILEEQGSWYKVQLEDGSTGYASSQYIKKTGTTQASKPEITVNKLDKASRGEVYGIVVTKGSPLNIRAAQGSDAKVIGQLEKGSRVRILEEAGEWYKVELEDGKTGYASRQFLKKAGALKKVEKGGTGIVVTKGSPLNIREGKDKNSEIVTKVENGTKVKILETSGEWYQVELEDGTTGYASHEFISKK